MNKDQFIEYIGNPHLLNAESAVALETLVKEFPYCQSAQLLYTKNLHNLNDVRYNNQLKIAAAYAGDRKMLYALLRASSTSATLNLENNKMETPIPVVEILKKEPEKTAIINKVEEKRIEPVITGIKKEERSPEEILREAIAEIETRKKLEEEKKKREEKKPEEQKPEEQKLEEKKQEKKIIADELKKENEPDITENTTTSAEFEEVEELKREMSLLDELYTTQAIEASVELDIFKAEDELNKQIQSDLKKSLAEEEEEKKQKEKNPEEKENAAISFDTHKKYSFNDWLKLKKATQKSVENLSESSKTDDLIEKFIKSEPKLSKSKIEFYNPVNMARQSVTDSGELVTETLARIYVQQGAYAKAINAYEILSLRDSQKKAYFAARIEEIQKLIN